MRLLGWVALLALIPPSLAVADYSEECLHEGCSAEEVRELYSSYKEECIHEGCSPEEVIELAGGTGAVNAMLNDFRKRGFQVLNNTPGTGCFANGTIAKCRFLVLTCQDWYTCPGGHDSCASEPACPGGNTKGSWYACGICFGFDW